MFDAQIYVADLVEITIVLEMAPMITAIILADRCGAFWSSMTLEKNVATAIGKRY
ncbi:MAG: ABC transporter permease [Chlorobi bacterium]|nr:ABC transporter permease [Chlorobiota bacterium]